MRGSFVLHMAYIRGLEVNCANSFLHLRPFTPDSSAPSSRRCFSASYAWMRLFTSSKAFLNSTAFLYNGVPFLPVLSMSGVLVSANHCLACDKQNDHVLLDDFNFS